MSKFNLIAAFVVGGISVYITLLILSHVPVPKRTGITIPDRRVDRLEERVDNLERWAVRAGGKFK
jgi:hypothetical protein